MSEGQREDVFLRNVLADPVRSANHSPFLSCFALSLLLEKCFGRTSFMESRDMNILEYVAAGKVLRTDIVYGIA